MSGPGRLTILHVDDARGWGGGQQQVALLAREQAGAGHRVVLGCAAGSPLARRASADGIECDPTIVPGRGRLAAVPALRAALRRLRPDIVHAHTSHAHGLARLAVRGQGAPLLVVSRRTCVRPGRAPWARWKYGSGVDLYIAVAEAVARALVAGGVDPERVRVAHSSVDPQRFVGPPCSRAVAMSALGLPADARVVAAMGSLVSLKAHDDLIEAFARLEARGRAHHLVILGEGPRRGALEARAAALGLAGRIRLPGFRDDVARLLPHFDVVAQPSLVEGLPNALLDALMAGVPVVATPAGGTREIVDDARVGGLIVPFRAPARLAAALERLLDDADLAGRLASAGRARVAAEFVPGRMAEAVELSCRAALARRRGDASGLEASGRQVGKGRLRAWGVDAALASELLVRGGLPGGLPDGWPAEAGAGPSDRPLRPRTQGRGPVLMVDLAGHAAVLKRHTRGGLIGRLCRKLGPEAAALSLGRGGMGRLAEVTRRFRARGGSTPRFLGWLEVRRRGPLHVHYSVTARIPEAEPLSVLLDSGQRARRGAIADLARHLAAWHHAGLRHPDLNAGNILRSRAPTASLWVIDFDRVSLGRDVRGPARARMVARLFRSLAHLGLAPRGRETLRLALVYGRERTLLEGVPHARRRGLARQLLRGLSWRRRLFILHGLRGAGS